MLQGKIIIKILGGLTLLLGIFMFLCVPVALWYGDGDAMAFVISGSIAITVGALANWPLKADPRNIGKREGFLIVTLSWIIFSTFGSLPFLISGTIPSVSDAFFETMSGFTTTGASILTDIEALPHGILFWRSMTQWLGGMGIITLSIAVLPLLKIGNMQLFNAEVPGPTPDKLHPKLKETAKRLWLIYIFFTFAETMLLWAGEMNLFDAVCHSFTTMATGGYSTKNASIAAYSSPYIHWVITIFMIIAGTNFTLAYLGMKGKFPKVVKNEEFRFYISLLFISIVVIALVLFYQVGLSPGSSAREAAFQVVSIVTTTGFATADFALWGPFLTLFIFLLMFTGGSAGSTGGGVKMVRLLLLAKNSRSELRRLIHPNAVIPVRLNHKAVPQQVIYNIQAFIVFYLIITGLSAMVISIMGYDLITSLTSVAATLGNIGPGLGEVGPSLNYAHFPAFGKWFLSFLMLLGRLELFTVLVLLQASFYKH
ncbi:MAG: TrkH family potassium uptake protein [Marinilabiliaceae bacterium]|jgi:trk system potassium uptake protein TrkH|nr:TrkH family potassium uptake protein [Marinilabiliaceae bacterium]